mgnify:CR=1 FL=1
MFSVRTTPPLDPPRRPRPDSSLDRVFKALAKDIRREVLDALREGPKTTGELVMLFPDVSRFAVMQHLKVLSRAKLVVVRKSGRERHNFLNVVPIQQLYERWVGRYAGLWAGALTDLARRAGSPRPSADGAGEELAKDRRGARGGVG